MGFENYQPPQEIVNREVDIWILNTKAEFGELDEITVGDVTEICDVLEKELPNVPRPQLEEMVMEKINRTAF